MLFQAVVDQIGFHLPGLIDHIGYEATRAFLLCLPLLAWLSGAITLLAAGKTQRWIKRSLTLGLGALLSAVILPLVIYMTLLGTQWQVAPLTTMTMGVIGLALWLWHQLKVAPGRLLVCYLVSCFTMNIGMNTTLMMLSA